MPVEPILTLRVEHAFGDCAGPVLRAQPSTAAWLRGRGMGVRPLGDRLMVYRERDAAGRPRTMLTEPGTLGFTLEPAGQRFASVTDLAALRELPAPLFTNAGTAAADRVDLVLGSRRARASEAVVLPRDGPARLRLAGRPDAAATAADVEARSAAGVVTVQRVDAALGAIELAGPGVVAGEVVTITYPVRPRLPPDAMAEVEITIDQALIDARSAAGRAQDHVVPFTARSARWCYYVVAAESVPASEVLITVTAPPEELRGLAFGTAARRDLTANPDPGDVVGMALLVRLPAARRLLRFLSDAPVALHEQPIRGIELTVSGRRLFQNLPNPPADAFGALRGADGPTDTIHTTIFAITS